MGVLGLIDSTSPLCTKECESSSNCDWARSRNNDEGIGLLFVEMSGLYSLFLLSTVVSESCDHDVALCPLGNGFLHWLGKGVNDREANFSVAAFRDFFLASRGEEGPIMLRAAG